MKLDFTAVGFLLVIIGIIVIVSSSLLRTGESDSKFFVGGFVGFIPFGFGNDRKLVIFGIILTVIFAVFFLLWRKYLII